VQPVSTIHWEAEGRDTEEEEEEEGGRAETKSRKEGAEVTSMGWWFTLEGKGVTSVQMMGDVEMGCPVS
jgi:hypothetical protein